MYSVRRPGQEFQEHESGSNSAVRNAMTSSDYFFFRARVWAECKGEWGWRVVTTEKRLLPTRNLGWASTVAKMVKGEGSRRGW